MADEIVATLVGCKVRYEGEQIGSFLVAAADIRTSPPMLNQCKQTLADHVADAVRVPAELRDADWLARFRWIVRPMTQADMDIQMAYTDGVFEDV